MRVALLPYEMRSVRRLSGVRLEQLWWGDGETAPAGTVGDLGPRDHLIVFPSSRMLYRPQFGLRCRLSLILAEPHAVHARHYRAMRLMGWRYFLILTHNAALARALPNVRFLTAADPWISRPEETGHEKSRRMSLIASSKRSLEGHRLRHEIAAWAAARNLDLDVLGRGYRPFERKEDGLSPYRFSVVIENVREPGYFSEKLIDCILCDTVPVYWGATDIDRHFDIRGMVVCRNAAELRSAVETLGEEDYARLIAFARENREKALRHGNYRQTAIRLVREEAARREARDAGS